MYLFSMVAGVASKLRAAANSIPGSLAMADLPLPLAIIQALSKPKMENAFRKFLYKRGGKYEKNLLFWQDVQSRKTLATAPWNQREMATRRVVAYLRVSGSGEPAVDVPGHIPIRPDCVLAPQACLSAIICLSSEPEICGSFRYRYCCTALRCCMMTNPAR